MDGERFDEITKALATRTSRRQGLKLLAAGVLAGLSGRSRPGLAATPRGAACASGDLAACLAEAQTAYDRDIDRCADIPGECTGDPYENIGCGMAYTACRRRAEVAYDRAVQACQRQHGCGRCEECLNDVCVAKQCGPCQRCDPASGTCQDACNPNRCEVCVDGACVSECTGCQRCTGGPWALCEELFCDDPSQCCDPALGRCVGAAEVCAPGQVLDATCSCVCEVSCPEGQVPDPANGCACACVPVTCPGTQVQNPETCLCECPVTCPDGQSPNPETCACEGCPAGQEPCGEQCVDPCPEGQTRNRDTCDCEGCPAGKELCGETCYDPCPAGQTRNATCTCVCQVTCADGQLADPANNCECPCPAGTVACAGICCNEGEICCNGTCVDAQTDPTNCGGCGIACPTGEVCSAGTCQAACLQCQDSCCPVIEGVTNMYCHRLGSCCWPDPTAHYGVRCVCPIGYTSCGGICHNDGGCG